MLCGPLATDVRSHIRARAAGTHAGRGDPISAVSYGLFIYFFPHSCTVKCIRGRKSLKVDLLSCSSVSLFIVQSFVFMQNRAQMSGSRSEACKCSQSHTDFKLMLLRSWSRDLELFTQYWPQLKGGAYVAKD